MLHHRKRVKKIEGFLGWILSFFLFFLPLFFPPVFADLFDLPKMIFFYVGVTLMGLLTIIKIYQSKKIVLPPKTLRRILILFLGVYLVSTIFSINPKTSFLGVWQYQYSTYTGGLVHILTLYLLFLTVLNLEWSQKKLGNLSAYLVVSGVLSSGFGLYQYLNHFLQNERNFRIRSTIGEPNRLAFFLVAILPISFAFFLSQKKPVLKILAFLATNLIFLAIILTFSRASWIVVVLLLVTALLVNGKQIRKFIIQHGRYLIVAFLIYLFAIFAIPTIHSFIKEILVTRVTYVSVDLATKRGSTFIRLMEWQSGWKMFLDQPLLRRLIGLGPETIKFVYPKYQSPAINQFYPEKYWQTLALRNQYLHFINTIGLFGLLTFFTVIFWTIRFFRRQTKKNILSQGIFYGWLAIVFSSFFYYQSIITYTYFWAFLALISVNVEA